MSIQRYQKRRLNCVLTVIRPIIGIVNIVLMLVNKRLIGKDMTQKQVFGNEKGSGRRRPLGLSKAH
jgi:hypothetical protein